MSYNMEKLAFTKGLIDKGGIWFAPQSSEISYPETGNETSLLLEENSFWFRHRNRCIASLVNRYSKGQLFFDIGGGNGYVSKGLEDQGVPTVLVEPGIQGCLNAKAKGLSTVVCSTLENAGFQNNTLSAAGLFDVVEHIENDVAFLSSVNQYLVSGGKLYITVPAYNALWSAEDTDAGHYRRYTLDSMGKTLQAAGLEVVFSTYIFSVLPIPILLFRSLPSRLGIHREASEVTKHQKEHSERQGVVGSLLEKIWDWEYTRIQQVKPLLIGGSCLVVAQKKSV